MVSSDRGKLGNFLKEVINWTWDDFCRAEKDPKYTGLEATVFGLVRTTSEGKLGAIKLAIDRVDGKLETPVRVEYPKVWFVYPEATRLAAPVEAEKLEAGSDTNVTTKDVVLADPEPEVEDEPVETATLTLRQTLEKMADAPRQTVPLILSKKKEVEEKMRNEEIVGDDDDGIKVPLVKSVIAANLLRLAIEKNNFEAITEVFDQIDGKLVETIKVLGDDIYLTQYALEAPHGATKNKQGQYMIEAKEIAEAWKQKFSKNS